VVHAMQVAGAEVLVRETIRRLGNRIAPTIFCLDRLGTIGEELRADGVDVVVLDRKPGWDFRVSWKLARAAAARKLDVLHAHQYGPYFYAALAKPFIRHPPKLILTEHGRHYPDVVSPVRRAANRLVLDHLADDVNACIGFSARALARVDGFRGARIHIIENGIDVEHYGTSTQVDCKLAVGLDCDRRYLIHVARHHPVKDQATLLRGFARAAPGIPAVDLLLVGDGPLRGELESLCGELNIRSRVRFLGIRKDIPTVLQAADAFVLTSVSEAASLTLLEAMATGLPVVVSHVGGNPEIVRAGVDGLTFPRGDDAALSRCLVDLFRDAERMKAMGESARQRTVEHYQLRTTIDAYARLYGVPTG